MICCHLDNTKIITLDNRDDGKQMWSSVRKSWIHRTSEMALAKEWYFALVLEHEILAWFLDIQYIGLAPQKW